MKKDKAFMTLAKVFYDNNPTFIEYMRDTFDLQYYHEHENPGPDGIKKMMEDAVVAVVCVSKLPKDAIAAAPGLKLINVCGAGYNNIDLDAATQQGVPVTSGRGGNASSVTELTIATMINLSRHIPQIDQLLRNDKWQPFFGSEISGKTIGIVGLGTIGMQVAKIARNGFCMNVLAYDTFKNPEADAQGIVYTSLERLFSDSDYITIHIPLTTTTKGLIGSDLLSLMKPTAYILNMARGGIVDEAALKSAVTSKKIAGAGLDVFESELAGIRPVGENAWFKDIENIIVTPHIGGMTIESSVRMCGMARDNIEDVLHGRRPRWNLVNPEVYKA
jgi:D-3-phosphoglycerate dehydrogenase